MWKIISDIFIHFFAVYSKSLCHILEVLSGPLAQSLQSRLEQNKRDIVQLQKLKQSLTAQLKAPPGTSVWYLWFVVSLYMYMYLYEIICNKCMNMNMCENYIGNSFCVLPCNKRLGLTSRWLHLLDFFLPKTNGISYLTQ